jgi:hypothetical protein
MLPLFEEFVARGSSTLEVEAVEDVSWVRST